MKPSNPAGCHTVFPDELFLVQSHRCPTILYCSCAAKDVAGLPRTVAFRSFFGAASFPFLSMAATGGADDERPDSQRAQLNQDCLDIVVEFGATSLDVLTQLRTVGRAFDTAVRMMGCSTPPQSALSSGSWARGARRRRRRCGSCGSGRRYHSSLERQHL